MSTKQELIDEICGHLGIPTHFVSTGSTEPKEFLEAVIDQMGLTGLSAGLGKQALGKLIVEADGRSWLPEFDSTGATITKEGLMAIRDSVFHLTR